MFSNTKATINSSIFKNSRMFSHIFSTFTENNINKNTKTIFSEAFKVNMNMANECVNVNNDMLKTFHRTNGKGYDKVGFIDKNAIYEKIKNNTIYAINAKTDEKTEMAGFSNISQEEGIKSIEEISQVSEQPIMKAIKNYSNGIKTVYFSNFISNLRHRGFGSIMGNEINKICKKCNYDIVTSAVERTNSASYNSIFNIGFSFMTGFQDNFSFKNAFGKKSEISIFYIISFPNKEEFKVEVFNPSIIHGTEFQINFKDNNHWKKMIEENKMENRVVFAKGKNIVGCDINPNIFYKKIKDFFNRKIQQNFEYCNNKFDNIFYYIFVLIILKHLLNKRNSKNNIKILQ